MPEHAWKAVILLAEDEPIVRTFVQKTLTFAGYYVLSAADGAEALLLSRAHRGAIDLLLSDVQMPKMTGPELARTVIKERPGIRILLMTGKSSGDIPQQWGKKMLRKPFMPQQLVERIQQTLTSPPSQG